MSRIPVMCERNKKTLRFSVPSPLRDSSILKTRSVEFSDETPERDWKLLSEDGLPMMKALSRVLSGRDDYAIVFDGYTEVTLYSDDRWERILPKVIRVFADWMKIEHPEVILAPDCEEKQRAWLRCLIASSLKV